MNYWIAAGITFFVTAACTPLVRILAQRLKIIDEPSGRKIHQHPTPLLGGGALFIGFIAACFLYRGSLHGYEAALIAAVMIFILGLIEDARGIPAALRFFIQVGIALFLFTQGIHVTFLPPGILGKLLEIAITVGWIVGVTNAYNYLDGMDGLAVGSAVINCACFLVILYATGQHVLSLIVVIMLGACLGFLPYNALNAKIFLGEAGSTLIGFSLAVIALLGNWAQDNVVRIFIPVFILGVPIFDMIFTTVMRYREGKIHTLGEWLRYGGRDHFHHYLVDLGLSRGGAVLFIYCVTLSLGISAIMVSNDNSIEAFLTLTQASIMFAVIATLIVVAKRRQNGWTTPER